MQNLHNDLHVWVRPVNRLGHQRVPISLALGIQFRCRENRVSVLVVNCDATFLIGRNPTGNNHSYTTDGTLRIKGRHALKAVGHLFKTRMH